MTREEAERCCGIPKSILDEYEQLWHSGQPDHYDERDIETLSLVVTLHDIGLSTQEVKVYMAAPHDSERLQMLERLRQRELDQIHHAEQQLERVDWLRHEIRKGIGGI